jgi:hypothetical protein
MGQDLADRPAMAEHGDALVMVAFGDPLDRAANPGGELLGGLGARDDVPALLGEHPRQERVSLGDVAA